MGAYVELSLSDTIHPKVRIEAKTNIGSIDVVLNDLVKPALLASGFMQDTVDKICFVGDEMEII